jgi:hypothetical protein
VKIDLGDCKEADTVCQREGNVILTLLPDEHVMWPVESLIPLLVVTLSAIRLHGSQEQKEAATALCRAGVR